MTLFFRALSRVVVVDAAPADPRRARRVLRAVPDALRRLAWLQRWWLRVRSEPRSPADIARAMDATTQYVLRNCSRRKRRRGARR
jgi:hypothetical protein